MYEQNELQASAPAKRGRGRPPANGKAKPVIDGDDDEDVSDEDSDDGGKKSKNAFGAKPPADKNKVENEHVVTKKNWHWKSFLIEGRFIGLRSRFRGGERG